MQEHARMHAHSSRSGLNNIPGTFSKSSGVGVGVGLNERCNIFSRWSSYSFDSVAQATVQRYGIRPGSQWYWQFVVHDAKMLNYSVTVLSGWRPPAWSWPWKGSGYARLVTLKGEQHFLRQLYKSEQKTWRPSVPYIASWEMPTSTSRSMEKP